jgi:hypothetical protein
LEEEGEGRERGGGEGEEEEGEEVIKNMVKHGEIRVDLGLKWNGWMDLSRTKWTSAQECVIKCDMLNGGVHCQRLWHVNKGREGREVKTLFPLKRVRVIERKSYCGEVCFKNDLLLHKVYLNWQIQVVPRGSKFVPRGSKRLVGHCASFAIKFSSAIVPHLQSNLCQLNFVPHYYEAN